MHVRDILPNTNTELDTVAPEKYCLGEGRLALKDQDESTNTSVEERKSLESQCLPPVTNKTVFPSWLR